MVGMSPPIQIVPVEYNDRSRRGLCVQALRETITLVKILKGFRMFANLAGVGSIG